MVVEEEEEVKVVVVCCCLLLLYIIIIVLLLYVVLLFCLLYYLCMLYVVVVFFFFFSSSFFFFVVAQKNIEIGETKWYTLGEQRAVLWQCESEGIKETTIMSSPTLSKDQKKESLRFTNVEPKLSDYTLKTLDNLKFDFMTPVQAATIPLFTTNKDVAVEACTGSGKTLA